MRPLPWAAAVCIALAMSGKADEPETLWSLEAKTLEGRPAKLEQYRGKVVLVVNVASNCGYTRQYSGLQQLQEKLEGRGFSVLAFPSNDFGNQEPGDAEGIRGFCETNYKVTFPLFEKCQTKAGEGQSPVYRFLGAATKELPSWNFCKYLVGRDGKPIAFWGSKVTPESSEIGKAIHAALAATAPEPAPSPIDTRERRKSAVDLARLMFEAVQKDDVKLFSACLLDHQDGRFLFGPEGGGEATRALQSYADELWRPRAEKLPGAAAGTFGRLEGQVVQGTKGPEIRDAVLVYTDASGQEKKAPLGYLVEVEDKTWKAHRPRPRVE